MTSDPELVILSLLAEEPRHGYDLDAVIAERGYRDWTALAFSSIYYLLKKMESNGWIEPVTGDRSRRAVYRLTDAGAQRMQEAAEGRVCASERPSAGILPALGAYASLVDPAFVACLERRAADLEAQLAKMEDSMTTANSPHAQAIFAYEKFRLAADLEWTQFMLNRKESSMKYDIKKDRKDLYQPTSKDFVLVDVEPQRYLAIEGSGDPNISEEYAQAIESLYTVAYATKFVFKSRTNDDFTVGPLEGIWDADGASAFTDGRKGDWSWTMLIPLPAAVGDGDVEAGLTNAAKKKPALPIDRVHLLTLHEGPCLQIMHIGTYDEEAPTLARLHGVVMPSRGWVFNGLHHEIYLSDPRRVDPSKMKTVLRQPVKKSS